MSKQDLLEFKGTKLQALELYGELIVVYLQKEKNKDYAEVQVWQSKISGGVNCFSSIRSHSDDEQSVNGYVTDSSKSLSVNHNELTDLLHKMLGNARFDENQRLVELIDQICARKENSITGHGHSLAMQLASSKMNPTAYLSHNFGGLAGIKQL